MVIKRSSSDESLHENENKRTYQLTVGPSMEVIQNEIIPQWIKTIRTVDKHTLEMFRIQRQIDDLQIRVKKLETQRERFKDIPYEIAEKQVIQMLKDIKKSGREKTNILELSKQLNLSIEQIDDIIEKLEKEGLVGDAE